MERGGRRSGVRREGIEWKERVGRSGCSRERGEIEGMERATVLTNWGPQDSLLGEGLTYLL